MWKGSNTNTMSIETHCSHGTSVNELHREHMLGFGGWQTLKSKLFGLNSLLLLRNVPKIRCSAFNSGDAVFCFFEELLVILQETEALSPPLLLLCFQWHDLWSSSWKALIVVACWNKLLRHKFFQNKTLMKLIMTDWLPPLHLHSSWTFCSKCMNSQPLFHVPRCKLPTTTSSFASTFCQACNFHEADLQWLHCSCSCCKNHCLMISERSQSSSNGRPCQKPPSISISISLAQYMLRWSNTLLIIDRTCNQRIIGKGVQFSSTVTLNVPFTVSMLVGFCISSWITCLGSPYWLPLLWPSCFSCAGMIATIHCWHVEVIKSRLMIVIHVAVKQCHVSCVMWQKSMSIYFLGACWLRK